jgi:putative phage-type endonuclease
MDFLTIDLEQGTDAWKSFRKGKVGASLASTIMGENPWQTPLQLWEEITFDKDRRETPQMKRGRNLESKARDWVNAQWQVDYQPKVIQSVKYPERIASLDGFYEKDGKFHLLEIKCPGGKDHLSALTGTIPAHHMAQLQHQMDVANVDFMYYCSFDGVEAILLGIERDKEYCKVLLREELMFLKRLRDFIPPEPCDRDWTKISDPEAILKAERLMELDSLAFDIEKEREQLRTELKEKMRDPRNMVGNLKIRKITRKGAVDYSKVEELIGVDLEQYRKSPISFWQFC